MPGRVQVGHGGVDAEAAHIADGVRSNAGGIGKVHVGAFREAVVYTGAVEGSQVRLPLATGNPTHGQRAFSIVKVATEV